MPQKIIFGVVLLAWNECDPELKYTKEDQRERHLVSLTQAFYEKHVDKLCSLVCSSEVGVVQDVFEKSDISTV